MTEEDLAATSEEAVRCRQPTVSSAGPPSASSPPALSSADIAALKESFPLLAEFSDDFIRSTPRGDLMKLQSTAYKLKEAEKGKDADEKLAANKAALATKFYKVSEGKDNRWNCLHPSRFLAGAACSATKLWTAARQNVEAGYPEIGSYDTSLQEGGSSSTTPRVTRCPSSCSKLTTVLPERPPSRPL